LRTAKSCGPYVQRFLRRQQRRETTARQGLLQF
jgi:hypothetical protein